MPKSCRIAGRILLFSFGFFCSARAWGAGFEHPDHGAVGMGRAGAFAATADDLTALAYNPAGLALADGARLLLDGTLTWNEVRFRRRETPYRRCTPDAVTGEMRCADGQTQDTVPLSRQPDDGAVHSSTGAFPAAFLGAAYGIPLSGGKHTLAIAAGFYAPPALGRYVYPSPDYSEGNFDPETGTFKVDPRIAAPQRYNLISSDIFVAYPSIAVAYRHADWLSLGATFQYVMFSIDETIALTDAIPALYQANPAEKPGCDVTVPLTCGPDRMREEDPAYDSTVRLQATGGATFTGVFGFLVKPHERVRIGGSYRPGFRVGADGKVSFQPSRLAQRLGVVVEGDAATLKLDFPHQARLGVAVSVLEGLDVEVDGTYEGWSSLDKYTITPRNVRISALGSVTELQPIVITKHWVDAWSVRLGAEYKLPLALPWKLGIRLRAGALYESSAVPLEYTSIDFPNWERVMETVGFSIDRDPIELAFSMGFLQQPTREVTNSQLTAVSTASDLKPFPVGNGTYDSNYTIAWLGLRAHF